MNAWHYLIFGYQLVSDTPISGLIECSSEQVSADAIHAHFGRLPSDLAVDDPDIWHTPAFQDRIDRAGGVSLLVKYFVTPDNRYLQLRYPDGLIFVFDKARNTIWTVWSEGDTVEHALPFFLGNALGIHLRLKGVVCLHASAVVVDGQVLVFAGQSGTGKSTLAATFTRRGYGLLTDDIVAITRAEGQYYVQPSYPQLRLFPETLSNLGYEQENALRVHPKTPKQFLSWQDFAFVREPQRLGGIYTFQFVPGAGAEIDLRLLPPKQGLIALMSRGYANSVLDDEGQINLLHFLGDLVQQIPVYRVTAVRDMNRIDRLCDRILAAASERSGIG